MSKGVVFVSFYLIFEILELWSNGCFRVWEGLMLPDEEQFLQFCGSKAKRIGFIISEAQ